MKVALEEARRIAVRAQLLDGSRDGRPRHGPPARLPPDRLVAPVERAAAPRPLQPARAGYDRAELDRLLWEERALFEWDAFIYPIEDLPLVRARIRKFRRSRHTQEPAVGRTSS